MKRFYFGLQGDQNIDDSSGMLYPSDLHAFRVGTRLARDLAEVRPQLQGNTCVVIAANGIDYRYCVSI
jgi:hypothetical protein